MSKLISTPSEPSPNTLESGESSLSVQAQDLVPSVRRTLPSLAVEAEPQDAFHTSSEQEEISRVQENHEDVQPGPLSINALGSAPTLIGSTHSLLPEEASSPRVISSPNQISSATTSSGRLQPVGNKLGRYDILEELGHGGMATVYRAHDPRLGRDVAIKIIHRHLRDNPEIAERFHHEARAVAKLKHPSIVEIYDVPDVDGNERFLVAELVEGPSLRKFIQSLQGESIPPEIAAALVLQILSALQAAHEHNIIHRDVKPENILLANVPTIEAISTRHDQQPIVKLTDFGIAKILDTQGMTSTGQILGSPAHMAPEQIEGGPITPKVDVFATGVLMYELLTGKLPFDGKNPAQVIRRVLTGDCVPPDRIDAKIGGRWSAIVLSMLARSTELRAPSAEYVAEQIRSELRAMGFEDPYQIFADFLRSPQEMQRNWGSRIKPRLLERSMQANAAGDVIGAAHDLNRALAYDPSDTKLIRTANTLRSRQRRARQLRWMAPIAVSSLGFFVIAYYGGRSFLRTPKPIASTIGIVSIHSPDSQIAATFAVRDDASMLSSTSSEPSLVIKTDPTVKQPTPPSLIVSAHSSQKTRSSSEAPLTFQSSSISANENATRRVRFNVFPPAMLSIDSGPALDTATMGERELTVGKHLISAVGNHGCCVKYNQTIEVSSGEGVLSINISLRFNNAVLVVENIPKDTTPTIRVQSRGRLLTQTQSSRISLPMSSTELEVSIEIIIEGFSTKIAKTTLAPGDPKYINWSSL